MQGFRAGSVDQSGRRRPYRHGLPHTWFPTGSTTAGWSRHAATSNALLALLLLHPNEPLSTDRLIDMLWGGRPPTTPEKTVQVHVSRLRRTLAAGSGNGSNRLIVTRDHGYELRLEPDDLDAHRFEVLVTEARQELAEEPP